LRLLLDGISEGAKSHRPRAFHAPAISFTLPALAALLACSLTPSLLAQSTPTLAESTPPGGSAASPTPLPYESCGWAWASQDLPKVTSAFRTALAAADLSFDTEGTYAYAFGENCLRPNGEVDHFATHETDFVVATTPPDLADLDALGEYAGAVLGIILSDFGPGAVPGAQRGRVDFVFIAGSEAARHQVLLTDAVAALENGLTGAELYRTLFR